MNTSNLKPHLNAMLICDTVITEVGTNKKSLIGLFENISASSFPCAHPSLSVFVKFTDALGIYKFALEFVNFYTDIVVAKTEIPEIDVVDKLASYELVFNLHGIVFNEPGKYAFRIFANGEFVGQKPFMVHKKDL